MSFKFGHGGYHCNCCSSTITPFTKMRARACPLGWTRISTLLPGDCERRNTSRSPVSSVTEIRRQKHVRGGRAVRKDKIHESILSNDGSRRRVGRHDLILGKF